jgi:hypothetical protein
VNLTTFAPHTKKKMHSKKESLKVGRRRVWRGWKRGLRRAEKGQVPRQFSNRGRYGSECGFWAEK